MSNCNNNDWQHDYKEFIKSANTKLPAEIKVRIFNKMLRLMNPKPLTVFWKILGIHIGIGFFSLSICHQFGINPFNTEKSLADWMMRVGGHQLCMIGCGVLFVSLSFLAAGYFLSIEEVKALKRTEFLQTLALGLISLGFFAAFGAELTISLIGLWLLGGFIGGFLAMHTIMKYTP